jgi:hypothetical protein
MIYETKAPLFISFLSNSLRKAGGQAKGAEGGGQTILKARGSDGKYQGE